VVVDKVSKKTAMEKCKDLGGGGLVSIHNEAENAFILGNFIKRRKYKIYKLYFVKGSSQKQIRKNRMTSGLALFSIVIRGMRP
jgi:hypothetical protein